MAYPHSSSFLTSQRTETDPVAEKIVDELFQHYNLDKVDFLFRQIPMHCEEKNFPEFLGEYIDNIGELPEWIDFNKIKGAQNIFALYGREILLALLCRSLPMTYICENGAQVLMTTARLIDFPKSPKYERRLLETLQFLINVSSDKNTEEHYQDGLITIKKVRLIHATIRRYIHENEQWPAAYGQPINQEDQLITMCAFSIEVVRALRKMGVYLNEEEREAWCHLWFVTAYLLGVKDNLIPNSYEDCADLSKKILDTQARKSEAGIILVQSCVEFMSGFVPHHLLHSFSYSVFKYLNDEPYRSMMGLDQTHWFWDRVMPRLLIATLGIDQRLSGNSRLARMIVKRINKWLINGLERTVKRDQTYFYLPKALKT